MKNNIALIIARKLKGGSSSDESVHEDKGDDETSEDGELPDGAEESAQGVIDAIKGGRAKDLAQALYDFNAICGG